jgi:hypothetical protein
MEGDVDEGTDNFESRWREIKCDIFKSCVAWANEQFDFLTNDSNSDIYENPLDEEIDMSNPARFLMANLPQQQSFSSPNVE